MDDVRSTVTRLLDQWNREQRPPDELAVQLFQELRRLANHQMRGDRPNHTLQPTALVNEAWLRLAESQVDWNSRGHFFAIAATIMRRILVDHARSRQAAKRKKGAITVEFDDNVMTPTERPRDVLELDACLQDLQKFDPRMSRIIEMHYFAGLGYPEIAEVLGVSRATVGRELRMAKSWLRTAMKGEK